MTPKEKTARPPTKRALNAIASGLEEIEAHFQLVGFGRDENEPSEDLSSADEEIDSEEDDDYDRYSGLTSYDREEIEVAIDEFISSLITDRILKKGKPGKLPSFSDVFERLFGADHELSEKARKFEEYIKGYFGAIDYDDMRAAFDAFLEIRDLVRAKAEQNSDVAQS